MAEEQRHKTNLVVVTPYDEFFEGYIDSVTLPSHDGKVGVMAGHMPLVLAIFPGVATIKNGKEEKHFVLSEGYAEIAQHLTMIVCNSAEWPEDIDVKRAYQTLIDRTKKIKEAPKGTYKIKDWQEAINRAKARIHLIELCGSEEQKALLEKLRAKEEN